MNAVEKKLLFIVNPRAGKTKSRAPLFDAVSIFSKAGYLVRVAETRRHGDATELAERCGGDFDLVVCHGGDGTLNETVNGIMRLPREKRPPLSYLPGGSTNDFAASLSISSDPALAAQSAMRLQPRDLDVGVFNEKNFVYVASFGAFTRTAYTVPQDIKNMFGHFAYLLEGVKDLETLCPYPMKITADGEVFEGEYLFGAVCNSTSIAGRAENTAAAPAHHPRHRLRGIRNEQRAHLPPCPPCHGGERRQHSMDARRRIRPRCAENRDRH